MPKLALEGIRVTDATNSWAGPYATALLASLGAEVIKVESIQHLEPWRALGNRFGSEQYWERAPMWNAVNNNKLGITLDLTRPKGCEIFKRLVKVSDIVAENYTARVMKKFGLDYPVIKQINPGIIMISLPAHGSTGPLRDYPGFAYSIEQMSGIPQLTGYPDGLPHMLESGWSDPAGGANGMAAVMLALVFRQMTGKGQYIDLSQVEAETCMIGEAVVDYSLNKRIQPRRGNRHPFMSPHGFYCCQGDDLWVGIAVASDEEWQRFGAAIGNPGWAREARFADSLTRWHNQDELDKLVEEWTVGQDHYEVMDCLQRAGIAAGAVITSAELLTDPHLNERGTYQTVTRPVVGTHPYPVASAPAKLPDSPAGINRLAPFLGEHNEYVLGKILGMSEAEIKNLADDRIIGTGPLSD